MKPHISDLYLTKSDVGQLAFLQLGTTPLAENERNAGLQDKKRREEELHQCPTPQEVKEVYILISLASTITWHHPKMGGAHDVE